jgi:hypothetical protein
MFTCGQLVLQFVNCCRFDLLLGVEDVLKIEKKYFYHVLVKPKLNEKKLPTNKFTA